jgi:Lon protease (S16) C-terminal proteolytic domain
LTYPRAGSKTNLFDLPKVTMLGAHSLQTWSAHFCFVSLIALASLRFGFDAAAGEQRFFITVPILSVLSQSTGTVNYVAIQADRLATPIGPQIQFNEGSRALGRFRGGALSEDWKDAAHIAVLVACVAAGEDPRTWSVTLKNVSPAYLTDGPSASAAIAVAMLAALKQDGILPGVVMTGAVDPAGRILPVGALPEKIQAAAAGGFSTVLIPIGQTKTREWDLSVLADDLRVMIVEVSTLREAYEGITGQTY